MKERKDKERIPYILNGEIFRIESRDGDAVTVQCLYCPKSRTQKHYGNIRCTGNFHRHIKRRHPFLIDKLREMKKERSAECALARSERKRRVSQVEKKPTLYLQSVNEHFVVYDTVPASSPTGQQHLDNRLIIYDDDASSSYIEEQPPEDDGDDEEFLHNDAYAPLTIEQQHSDDNFEVDEDDAPFSSIEEQVSEEEEEDEDEAITANLLHELRSLPENKANQLRTRLQKILIEVRKKQQDTAVFSKRTKS